MEKFRLGKMAHFYGTKKLVQIMVSHDFGHGIKKLFSMDLKS